MAGARRDLQSIIAAGLASVEAGACVRRHLRLEREVLRCGELAWPLRGRGVVVVGAGKATAPMAEAVEEVLGERVDGGAIVVKDAHGLALRRVACHEAAHPVPDARGVAATRDILRRVDGRGSRDLVLCLLSGGASALLVAPAPEISLGALRRTVAMLLDSGAPIHEINAVRKHLSAVKGGGLALAAHPAPILSLILSDVIGNPLDTIASGPTVGDRSTFADCIELLERRRLTGRLPEAVRRHLEAGAAGRVAETPRASDPRLRGVHNVVVGDNRLAIAAALEAARQRGYTVRTLGSDLAGDVSDVACRLAAAVRETRAASAEPVCLVGGGEATVEVRGDGHGGRNQQLALAVAVALHGMPDVEIASIGTDGTDGPTAAAGARVDGSTLRRAVTIGLDPDDHLRRNDSHTFFAALGDLIVTGPTRTNVMDLHVALVGASDGRDARASGRQPDGLEG